MNEGQWRAGSEVESDSPPIERARGQAACSAGGALIEHKSRPAVGESVTLFVEDVAEMPGIVVRHTGEGFALRFELTAPARH